MYSPLTPVQIPVLALMTAAEVAVRVAVAMAVKITANVEMIEVTTEATRDDTTTGATNVGMIAATGMTGDMKIAGMPETPTVATNGATEMTATAVETGMVLARIVIDMVHEAPAEAPDMTVTGTIVRVKETLLERVIQLQAADPPMANLPLGLRRVSHTDVRIIIIPSNLPTLVLTSAGSDQAMH